MLIASSKNYLLVGSCTGVATECANNMAKLHDHGAKALGPSFGFLRPARIAQSNEPRREGHLFTLKIARPVSLRYNRRYHLKAPRGNCTGEHRREHKRIGL